jgi:hypothetical protein
MKFKRFDTLFMSEAEGGDAAGSAGAGGGAAPDGGNGEGAMLNGGSDGNGGVAFGEDGYKYAGKYESVQDLEKGYEESVSMHTKKMAEMGEKLKGFVGAPEEGYELPAGANEYSEPVMNVINEWGKKNGLSQEAYSELLQEVAKAEAKNLESFKIAEMEKLGENAQARIDNINDKWAATFGAESLEVMNNMATSAEGVKFFEAILAQTSPSTVNPDGGNANYGNVITDEELDAAMFAKDSAGMLKMQTDPEYKKKVDAMTIKYNKQRGIA